MQKKGDQIGKDLLLAVYSFALENNISFWRIYSLPFESLIKYYESFGFKRGSSRYRNGEIKVVEMEMNIEQENKKEKKSNCINDCTLDDPNEFLYISDFEHNIDDIYDPADFS